MPAVNLPPNSEAPRARATLEIVGQPGESLAIYAETALDLPPPPIYEGRIPPAGRIRLRLPRVPLLLVAGGCGRRTVSFNDDENFKTVSIGPSR